MINGMVHVYIAYMAHLYSCLLCLPASTASRMNDHWILSSYIFCTSFLFIYFTIDHVHLIFCCRMTWHEHGHGSLIHQHPPSSRLTDLSSWSDILSPPMTMTVTCSGPVVLPACCLLFCYSIWYGGSWSPGGSSSIVGGHGVHGGVVRFASFLFCTSGACRIVSILCIWSIDDGRSLYSGWHGWSDRILHVGWYIFWSPSGVGTVDVLNDRHRDASR